MSQIKTYNKVDRQDTSLSFSVSKMESSYVNRKGVKDVPHRHNYYTVILVNKAKGKHYIDFNEYELSDNQVFFVSPGQVHQIIENEQSFGYGITFSTQFLISNNIPLSFIEDLNLFNTYGNDESMKLSKDQTDKLTNYCDEILYFHNSGLKFKQDAIGSSLKLFLIYCNNLCIVPKDNTQLIQAGRIILRDFKSAVEKHFMEWHFSSEYAKHLNITADHLNRTIKALIGKTAKEYIQTRISIAAKRLLYFSDLSNKEIAYQLGFSEASNFSAFFKKTTTLSPSEFRKNR